MFIDKLSLRNIRGFTELDFDFARPNGSHAGWTVFTGDNGSGKSTLLKAIAIALAGSDHARALQPSFGGWIRAGADADAAIRIDVLRTLADDTVAGSGRLAKAERPFPLQLALTNGGRETGLKPAADAGTMPGRTVWATDAKGWFSCGYGPFRRMFGASPEAARQMVAPATERFVTMFQEAASLAEVDQWLRSLSHKKLEEREAEAEQLELVLELLRDELLPNQIVIDRVDSDGLWLRDRHGTQLSWHEMSDGYRSALALLTDILRHLIAVFGVDGLTERVDGRLRVIRSGVVLIDEVDAHLHPQWQRQIGFWLKGHFPNIQFLVTTHSPIICQAADPNGLFVLPDPGGSESPRALTDDEYRTVIASRPDTILLTPAFGLQNTRSPWAIEGRAKLAALQAKRRAGAALSAAEQGLERQLSLFATSDEAP